MGMTIEFYSAEPQAFQALFVEQNGIGDGDRFFEILETYPKADFSFHLHIPEDLDSLCQVLRGHTNRVPSTFHELVAEQLWSDGISKWVLVLKHTFAVALASMSTSTLEQAALDWAKTFPYQEPLQHTPAYTSLLQLREVALDAITRNTSLLFYLVGNPAFFRWE